LHAEESRQKRTESVSKTLWTALNNAKMRDNSPDQLTPETTKGNPLQSDASRIQLIKIVYIRIKAFDSGDFHAIVNSAFP